MRRGTKHSKVWEWTKQEEIGDQEDYIEDKNSLNISLSLKNCL